MDKTAVKDVFYAGIKELLSNSSFYYHSTISSYCQTTEAGDAAILDFIKIMAPVIMDADREDLNKRAKEMVLENLKGKEEK